MFGSVSDRAGRLVPALVFCSSLRGYRRSWVPADVLAALTLFVIAVPEQLATSRLADMPPITGFYAFAAGTVLFALLGSNPQMSVGADSTIAPLFAVGVAHLAPAGSPQYVDLVGILAVAVGVFVGLVWLLRLGWIAEFLSAPIIVGFLAGIAVIIVVHQIPDLFGLAGASGSTVHRLAFTVGHLGQTNGRALGTGVAVLAIVIAAERIAGSRERSWRWSPRRSSSPLSVFRAMEWWCWAAWLMARRGSGWLVCPGRRFVAWRRSRVSSRWWW
ncbi:MAG: SulP family inorganic anion transporter [Solirubrobacteraceae bacterium]